MSTSMQSLAELSYEGREVLCNSIALVLQSLFYGIFWIILCALAIDPSLLGIHIVVIPFAAHILLYASHDRSIELIY